MMYMAEAGSPDVPIKMCDGRKKTKENKTKRTSPFLQKNKIESTFFFSLSLSLSLSHAKP